MNELSEMVQLEQADSEKKGEAAKDMEATQKQLAEELEKCHSHIDEQNKCMRTHMISLL